MAKKPKFYVVWKGRTTGVFNSWEDCKAQTTGFDGSVFKSFETREAAEKAYHDSSSEYVGKNKKIVSSLSKEELALIGDPIDDSIAVDGAWDNTRALKNIAYFDYHRFLDNKKTLVTGFI